MLCDKGCRREGLRVQMVHFGNGRVEKTPKVRSFRVPEEVSVRVEICPQCGRLRALVRGV